MSYNRLKLESPVQTRILRELREKLSERFGITVVGPYVTLRWKEKENHRSVSMIVLDIDSGELVESTLWKCDSRKMPGSFGKTYSKPCAYNHDADPAHDSCVFCGEPEERK